MAGVGGVVDRMTWRVTSYALRSGSDASEGPVSEDEEERMGEVGKGRRLPLLAWRSGLGCELEPITATATATWARRA